MAKGYPHTSFTRFWNFHSETDYDKGSSIKSRLDEPRNSFKQSNLLQKNTIIALVLSMGAKVPL